MAEIEIAYRNTTYLVDHPDGVFGMRLGEPSPRLDALLYAHGVKNWAYVTAWNPCSERTPAAVNAARNEALRACVSQSGYPVFAGRGQPDCGDWVAEDSLLILGMDEAAALALGRRFGQLAIVIGEMGGCAELRWCGHEK